MDLKKPVPSSHVAVALTCVALILWRIWAVPLVGLWRDAVVLLAIYGAFIQFAPVGRFRTSVTVATMAGLMLLYGKAQYPALLAFLSPPS
jgi:hypothetical protein